MHIFCKLGFHEWLTLEPRAMYEPGSKSGIVTLRRMCDKCGRVEHRPVSSKKWQYVGTID